MVKTNKTKTGAKNGDLKSFAKKWKLDEEEMDVLSAFEAGKLNPLPNQKKHIKEVTEAARAFTRKNSRLNIRISDDDLLRLKIKAAREGLPYQTLAASIIHKFVYETLGKNN
jgi:predicted DNA binding CopG/RHH family protein